MIKERIISMALKRSRRTFVLAWGWAAASGLAGTLIKPFLFPFARVALSARLIGMRSIAIGRNTLVSSRTWLNVNHPARGRKSIVIGNNCIIGENNFLSSGRLIEIGDYVITAKDCAFLGSTHVYSDPCVPYGWCETSDRDTISVGTNCFFGYGAQVIGNVSIGRGSVVGANAVVRTDVPPFSLVVGDPASIIKRYSFRLRQWIRCSSDTQEHELDHPDEDEYQTMLGKGNVLLPSVLGNDIFNSSY